MVGRQREPMKEVRVRQASDEDLDGLAQSSAALFVEDGLAHDQLRNPGWPGTDGATWCAALVADPAALVLVATADDEVVGHLVGTLVEASAMWLAPRAELVSTFVSPSWRNQGVGGRLVEDFAAWVSPGPESAARRGYWSPHMSPTTRPSGSISGVASRRCPRNSSRTSRAMRIARFRLGSRRGRRSRSPSGQRHTDAACRSTQWTSSNAGGGADAVDH